MPVAKLWQNPHHYCWHEAPHSHSSPRVSQQVAEMLSSRFRVDTRNLSLPVPNQYFELLDSFMGSWRVKKVLDEIAVMFVVLLHFSVMVTSWNCLKMFLLFP